MARIERRAYDWIGLRHALKEDGHPPYVDGETDITTDLADHAADVADAAEVPINDALSIGYINESQITAALGKSATIWQNKAWEKTLETKVRDVLDGLVSIGVDEIDNGPELPSWQRARIIDGMSASSKYYTNNYFNTQVFPAVADAAHKAVLGGKAHDGQELEAIRALLDNRLRSVPYWNLVANAAASRAYHYGYIKTGVASGLDTVEFHATVDVKTSAVCLAMNGTRWSAASVSLFADKIALAQGDDIKTVAPWPKLAQVSGLTPIELLAMGVVIPPLHGRCRSKLIFT